MFAATCGTKWATAPTRKIMSDIRKVELVGGVKRGMISPRNA
jgi:hypothetical protein